MKIQWVLRKGITAADADRIYADCTVKGRYFATIVQTQDATFVPPKYALHIWGHEEAKDIPVASLRTGMDMVEARIGVVT